MSTATLDRPLVTQDRPTADQNPVVASDVPVKQLLRWQDDGGAVLDAG